MFKIETLLGALIACLPITTVNATDARSVASPDGRCVISLKLNDSGELSYEVSSGGKPVILPSPMGLCREDETFERGLLMVEAGPVQSRREAYELFAGILPHVDHKLNHRSFTLVNSNKAQMTIELAAGNEGVAFRYGFPGTNELCVLRSELTGFSLPQGARGWLQPYHAATDYAPAYEDFYFNVSLGERPPRSRGVPVGWCFPALFQGPDDTWALLTESGNDGSFCGCHLAPDSSNGVYQIAFPLANEGTKRQPNKFSPEPRHSLPWSMPWRVFVIGPARQLATSTLVTDLAPPSRIADTSWIRPGRASWAWWSYPDGPATAELFNSFTDFAARMHWEYTLFDAGWWKPGLSSISSYAQRKGVVPLAWCSASDFYTPERRKIKLDELEAAGVRGLKVDFWCSDRQEALAAMHALFEEAAARKMVVNLHGCTLPRGWQRTWPNFVAAEAVLGAESYFYESQYSEKAAELNTVLPFTRNVAGPMDYTPVACSPKKYVRNTTAAHELAAALVFTSGIIHYADRPEFFESLPAEAIKVFRDAPARWDETRCLIGEPGRLAVFARRSGRSWFIAGINGSTNVSPVTLDLSAFGDFTRRLLIAEGSDSKMQVSVEKLPTASQWTRDLPPRGGFILRMDRE